MKNFFLTIRFYSIGIIVIGMLFLGIPYLIDPNTINITIIIYSIVILYFLVVISFATWLRKMARKIFNLPKYNFLEIIFSLIIYLIACPTIIILGIISILIMIICPKIKYHIMYMLVSVSVFVFGVRVDFYGSLPKERPLIITPNHTSFIDYLLILLTMGQKPYNVVAGSNLSYIPILGYLLKKYAIGVDRRDSKSLKKAYIRMIRELKEGKNLGIFPEGGRITESEILSGIILKEFKDGPFAAAKNLSIKIVPVIFHGTKIYAVKNKKCWWYVSPTKIKIFFLETISPENKTVEELKNETFKAMFHKIKKLEESA